MIDSEVGNEPPKIYTGLDEQHGVPWIEKGWKVQSSPEFPEIIKNLHVDDRITEIVTEQLAKGNKEIVVVDVGSGSEGYFIKAFLDSKDFPKLHKLLSEQSSITVRVVGVTGADDSQTQGTLITKEEQVFGEDSPGKSKVIVENYGYTITRAHTLKNFLNLTKIHSINLSLSTFGLGYFTPANFDQCVTEIADNLVEGGEFYGISWDTVPAGAIRSPFGGLFIMRGRTSKDHPLNKMFGGLSDNEAFRRFYAQTPEKQVQSHIDEIEYCISSGLISLEQAIGLLTNTDILPMPAFVRYVHKFATEGQRRNITNYIHLLSWRYPWLSNFKWTGDTPIFDEMRSSKNTIFEEGPKSTGSDTGHKKNQRNSYRETEAVEHSLWKYVERRFSSPFRKEVTRQKNEFNKRFVGSNWEKVKNTIKSLDPAIIATFWDWDRIAHQIQQIIIEKQTKKTTEMKQSALDRLAQREDLIVHSSRFPENHGLNVYIKKRKNHLRIFFDKTRFCA